MASSLAQSPAQQPIDRTHIQSIAVSSVGLALVVIATLPSALAAVSHFRRKDKATAELYEDQDGVATEESMVKYSAKWPKTFLSVFATLGFAFATASAVLATVNQSGTFVLIQNWLSFLQWVFVVFQAVSIGLMRDSTKAYSLGLYNGLSCGVLFAELTYQTLFFVEHRDPYGTTWQRSEIILHSLELVTSVFAALASVSLPRRPEIFHNGLPVDAMHTRSALEKFNFGWVGPLLMYAKRTKHLDLKDLPRMSHYARAKDLSDTWASKKRPQKLWVALVFQYKWPLITQWLLTLVQSFGNFAPQFVIFQILKILERRGFGEPASADAWIWVLILAITSIGASWVESWLFWVSWSELGIPLRSQLAALIFQKSMRRKDVKGAAKKSKEEQGKNRNDSTASEDRPEEENEEEEEEKGAPKGKQLTVNLIGVDAKRVSEFGSFNFYFPGSLFKLLVSFTFLWSILGWKPLLAGFLAMSLTIPINIYFSQRYSEAQDRLMKARDAKLAVVTEALQGIRQIKFSALEKNWFNKIHKVRTNELGEQWSVFATDTVLAFCWIASPILLSATSLTAYALFNGSLTPSIAFTAIGVFGSLEVTLSIIPELTTDLIDAYVSISRIEKYLRSPEISSNASDTAGISFENASVAWPSDEKNENGGNRYVLRDLNLSFPENELSVVGGKTGTGKSLLLAAILGECDILSGKVNVPRPPSTEERHDQLANKDNWIIPSSIAFVAQIPWIENASIRENILFGLPFDEDRYNKVIESCALRKDLEMLTDGENTEIGANGINLSGGQKWRVTFARALYSRAGILILDDIFSAVDAHVGRYIYENGLTGELGAGRTRILVTHHLALVKPRSRYIVELADGRILNAGLTEDLEQAGALEETISRQETEAEVQLDEDVTAVNSEESSDAEVGAQLKKVSSKTSPKKFVEEETREKGRVKSKIYMTYLKASGGFPFWSTALLLFVVIQCFLTGRSWWLKVWTSDSEKEDSVVNSFFLQTPTSFYASSKPTVFSNPESEYTLKFYLEIYVALSIGLAIISTFRWFYLYQGSIRASRTLFDNLCATVIRTPLRWTDTVPLGRILNRFTADFEVIDARLANNVSGGVADFFQIIGVIIAGIFVSPYVIVLSVLLLAVCVWIASIYLYGAREVKRLESTAKSPVFEQFGSALTGVSTIRAFSKTDAYVDRMFGKIDNHSTAFWHLWLFNRWMGWRMTLIGSFFSAVVAAMILILPNVDASLAGFALSFALQYGQTIIWIIRHYANLELEMNAAERIIEYSNVPTESQDGADPPAAWPSEGRIEVNDLVVSYASDLPPVLKGVTFRVERSERIGVVGRTGAGKSSLTLALFRFLEASQGSIHIDGLDISKIKLHSLRSRLAIIPQDPVLFSGTVRSNLDAFDEHTDTELREVLERVHLVAPSGTATPIPINESNPDNVNPFNSLSSPIAEGGLNLSQGQRQLLCLARAIISRPKIVVLDEATSAVDMATDTLIQRSIRDEFVDSTLIVIAHRLSTISDFDKILVLDDGRVAEFGTPRELMAVDKGIFKGMVFESGDKDKLEKIILG